ncbi:MAG TPA: GNAT family N-acetyltransferase [Caulobacteraceae bacterium]|nr:GNAT family N-acetyltransferase [Caulobacteraceae bacterium]
METHAPTTQPTLRTARPTDAMAIAQVHVASWRETYAGSPPGAVFAARAPEDAAAFWAARLGPREPGAGGEVFVAETEGRIIAFGACGAQRTTMFGKPSTDAEIEALHVLKPQQGQGVGRRLMTAMADGLLERGYEGCCVWIPLPNDGARAFFERWGGEPVAMKKEYHPQSTVSEVAYRWRDLTLLAQSLKP